MPPPENVFSRLRTLSPPKFFWIAETALRVDARRGDVGAEPVEPSSIAVNRTFFRISPTRNAPRIVEINGAPSRRRGGLVLLRLSISWQVPPAASICSRAAAAKPWAWTVNGLVSSPLASTLTGMPLRVARPLATIASSVTAAPASNRLSRSRRLTGWVCVRNGSNGIDFFMCGPRSLRIRM